MSKKEYLELEYEVEKFTLSAQSITTTSSLDDGDDWAGDEFDF